MTSNYSMNGAIYINMIKTLLYGKINPILLSEQAVTNLKPYGYWMIVIRWTQVIWILYLKIFNKGRKSGQLFVYPSCRAHLPNRRNG